MKVIRATGASAGSGHAQGVGQAFTRPPENHEVYSLVGRVVSDWSHLELSLDQIIWDLAKLDAPTGACITGQFIGVWSRFRAIQSLLTHQVKTKPGLRPLLKKVNQLEQDSQGSSEQRNRIVHDPWYAEVTNAQIAQHRSWPKKDRIFGLKDSDRNEIMKTLKKIDTLNTNIKDLRNAILTVLQS